MKNTIRFRQLFIVPLLVLFLGWLSLANLALADTYPDSYANFSEAELAQMLAPIALYPDALLTQVLMASTYPIEIIEADRWISDNRGLTGDAMDDALLDRGWDPSVKALCHFPSVLALMSERIGETTDLGNAFLAQESEVMAMVQKLRTEAYAQGHLSTTAQQTVVVHNGTIVIEPANPAAVYVPYYDPLYVYGSWWYPAYPPYFWGPARVNLGFGIHYWPGTYFSFSFGSWSYFDWPRHTIFIDVQRRPRFVRHDHWQVRSGRWRHAPQHRRGVSYRNPETARTYGQANVHFNRIRPESRRLSGQTDRDRYSGPHGDRRTGITQPPSRTESSWRERRHQDLRHAVPVRQVQRRSERERQNQARLSGDRAAQNPPTAQGNRQLHDRSVRSPAQRANLNRSKMVRQVAEPVRQVRQHTRQKQQGWVKQRQDRPAQRSVQNNRQGQVRSVGQIRHRVNPTLVKSQRQSVKPAWKIRERQQVHTAERGLPQQKTTTAVGQNRESGQFFNRFGSDAGKRVSSKSDRSWRGSRGNGSGADDRKSRGRFH
ncbi:MAG TPA: DUF3300 domain-containing protein [Geothermobacteraceae bacterium]|nr:DUF3300 domain-containing protein [Geothermobacteraceae bacterium]